MKGGAASSQKGKDLSKCGYRCAIKLQSGFQYVYVSELAWKVKITAVTVLFYCHCLEFSSGIFIMTSDDCVWSSDREIIKTSDIKVTPSR